MSHQEKTDLFTVERNVWCCSKTAREVDAWRSQVDEACTEQYMKKWQTNGDRVKGQHIHCWLNLQLLVSLPMRGTGGKQLGNRPSLFGALTYLLSDYSSNFTCILRIWLPLFTKSQALNWMSPDHAQLYTVIYIKWSLSKRPWLSEYNWPFTSRNMFA